MKHELERWLHLDGCCRDTREFKCKVEPKTLFVLLTVFKNNEKIPTKNKEWSLLRRCFNDTSYRCLLHLINAYSSDSEYTQWPFSGLINGNSLSSFSGAREHTHTYMHTDSRLYFLFVQGQSNDLLVGLNTFYIQGLISHFCLFNLLIIHLNILNFLVKKRAKEHGYIHSI